MKAIQVQSIEKDKEVGVIINKSQYLNVPIELIINAYQNKYLNALQFFFGTQIEIQLWKGKIKQFRVNSS